MGRGNIWRGYEGNSMKGPLRVEGRNYEIGGYKGPNFLETKNKCAPINEAKI